MWFFTSSSTGPSERNRRPSRRQPACANKLGRPRPGVERLEDRTMPAPILVNTFADLPVPPDDPLSLSQSSAPTNGPMSLRQAIALAANSESHGGDDTIILPHEIGGVAGTYALSLGELVIFDATGKLTIQSAGGTATIDAQHNSRVFEVFAGSEAVFQGLTITHGGLGANVGDGGGVANSGTLTITHCTVGGNAASLGGGVSNRATLTIEESIVSGNTAEEEGNGIENTGTLTITGSMVIGNTAHTVFCTGGGVDNFGPLTITDTAVSDNTASLGAGVASSGPLTINQSTFSNNKANGAGGLFCSNKVTITNSTFTNNTGNAAIEHIGGTLTLTNSKITVNQSTGVLIEESTGGQLLGNTITHNSGDGVRIDGTDVTAFSSSTNQLVGNPLAGNTIAFNGGTGVAVVRTSSGIAIRGNSIYANSGPGIDLGDDGLTPNGPGSPRNGPNHLQNFPVLAEARSDGQGTSVQGLLNSLPNSGFLLDFYSSPPDGSSQVYAGSRAVITDSFGNAVFEFVLPATVPGGWTLTATATTTANSPYGDTSEFASPIGVTGQPPITLGPASLPHATAGVDYTRTLTASGGAGGPYTFAVTAGALPRGLILSAGGVLSGTSTTAATSAFTVTATDISGRSGSQAITLTVDPAIAVAFAVGGFPSPVTAGVPGAFSVTARDRFNNVATGYSGTVSFRSSDLRASLPANASLSGGRGSFSATFKTAGSQSLTVQDTLNPSLTGSRTSIVVNAASVRRFTLTGPATVTNGTAFSVRVAAVDAFGNVATNYPGTVRIVSSDGTATLPGMYSLTASDKGVHTFTGLILRKKGTQSIVVTDNINGRIVGAISITVL
jgi:hypothetical protein